MTRSDREAKQSTTWPSADDFWTFSTTTYSHAPMKEACLEAQESLGADVNLLLLCLWMDDHGVRPTADNWDMLIEAAHWWQEQKLSPLRMARRALKGQDGYDDAKEAELKAEAQEQRALLKCLIAPPRPSAHERSVWPCVSTYLQICGDRITRKRATSRPSG